MRDGQGMWHTREMRNVLYEMLIGKPEGKRPLKRHKKIFEWILEKQDGKV
jgi:hypothetical protein